VRLIIIFIGCLLSSILLQAQVKVSGKKVDLLQNQKQIVIADTIRIPDNKAKPPKGKVKNTKNSKIDNPTRILDSLIRERDLKKAADSLKTKTILKNGKVVDSLKIKKPVVKAVDSTKTKTTLSKVQTLRNGKVVDSLKIKKPVVKAVDSTKIKTNLSKIQNLRKGKVVDSLKIKKPVVKAVDSTKIKTNLRKGKVVDSLKIKNPVVKTIDSTKIKKTLKKVKVTDSTQIKKQIAALLNLPKRDATRLKVMSYNLRHGVGSDGKINLLRLVALIKKHQPDVVALQEIDSGMVRSGKLFQARIISLLTGYDEIYGKVASTKEGNHGLAILTKHSFQDFQNIQLPSPEATEPRNMLSVVIALPNNRLIRFCNTQLDYKSPLNRGIQAAIISKNLGYGLYPTLLCGNFNAAIDDHTIDFLPKYWDDAGMLDPSPTHLPTARRIDYFWTLKNNGFILCEYQVLKELKTAECYPILAVYELNR
jgi:endonuclease/exonuclease/phosphatase family metal-dependent hydrolase